MYTIYPRNNNFRAVQWMGRHGGNVYENIVDVCKIIASDLIVFKDDELYIKSDTDSKELKLIPVNSWIIETGGRAFVLTDEEFNQMFKVI